MNKQKIAYITKLKYKDELKSSVTAIDGKDIL